MIGTMVNTDLTAYYAQRAIEYEKIYLKPEREHDLLILKDFLKETFRGKDAIEIACGTGYWTHVIAETARSILATDYNSEVLAVAKSKSYRCSRISFQIADAFLLDSFAPEFNADLCAFWWSHIPKNQISQFVKSFHSPLQKSATVVIVDNLYVERSSTPIHRTDAAGNTYQLRQLQDGSVHEIIKNFPTKDEILNYLSPFAANIRFRSLEYFWIAEYSI